MTIQRLLLGLVLLMSAGVLHGGEADMRPRCDAWGDPLPPGALFRTGTIRAQHSVTGPIRFSPDGKTLAAVGHDHTIRLWDAATGKDIRTFPGHGGRVHCLAFSADGKTLASGGWDKAIRLWEVANGKEVGCLTGHENEVFYVIPAPCGTWLASCDAKDIRFWDLKTGKETRRIPSGGDTMLGLTLSPDGSLVAVESHDNPIRIWETATGNPLNQFKGTKSQLEYPHFLPDGKTLLTSGYSAGVTLWEVASGKKIRHMERATGPLAVSPNGQLLATGCIHQGPGVIRIWSLSTGKLIRKLRGHIPGDFYGLSELVFSPDGTALVSLGDDRTLRRWDVKTGKELDPPVGHQNPVTAIAFSPNGKLLASGSFDRTVRLWDPIVGREIRSFRAKGEVVQGIAFLDGGNILLSQNHVPPSGQPPTYSMDDYLIRVRLWDVATGRPHGHWDHRKDFIRNMAISPQSQTLAQGGGDKLRLVEPASGRELPTPKVERPNRNVEGLAFSPGGDLLAVTSNQMVMREATWLRLWNVATGKECWQKWEPFETFKHVAYSPGGKILATSGRDIRLWEAATGKELDKLQGGHGPLAFSPDGKTLATCGPENSVILWEVATKKVRRRFAGHEISCLAFSPDGRLLASGGIDTLVMAWDVTGRLEQGSLRPGPANAQALEDLWARLAAEDAAVAYDAAWGLIAMPIEGIPFLKQHLPLVSETELKNLVVDLDDEEYAVRQRATERLEALGSVAEGALRRRLEEKPSPEVRRRAEDLLRLLQQEEKRPDTPELRRGLRLVEVLEQVGTVEAKEALHVLDEQARWIRLRQEAKASLIRLGKPPNVSGFSRGKPDGWALGLQTVLIGAFLLGLVIFFLVPRGRTPQSRSIISTATFRTPGERKKGKG